MNVFHVGSTLITNTQELETFLRERDPGHKFLYVCSPEFYKENEKVFYRVHVNMYMRKEDGRRLEAH